jgi:hypothetical protein
VNLNTDKIESNKVYDLDPGTTYTLQQKNADRSIRTFTGLTNVTFRRKPGVAGPNPIIRVEETTHLDTGQAIALRFEKCSGIVFSQIDWKLPSRWIAITLDGCTGCTIKNGSILARGDGNTSDDGNGYVMIRTMKGFQSRDHVISENSCYPSLTGNFIFTGRYSDADKPNFNIQIKRNRVLSPPRGEHAIRIHNHENFILEDNYVDARWSIQNTIVPVSARPAKGGALNIRDGLNCTVKRGRYWGAVWIGPLQMTKKAGEAGYEYEQTLRLKGLKVIGAKINGYIHTYRGTSDTTFEDSCIKATNADGGASGGVLTGKGPETDDDRKYRPLSAVRMIRCKMSSVDGQPLNDAMGNCKYTYTDCTFQGNPVPNT